MPKHLFCSLIAGELYLCRRWHSGREGLSPGDTVPSEGPYVLRNNQVLESGGQAVWDRRLAENSRQSQKQRRGKRIFLLETEVRFLFPFGVCRVLTFLKGQEQCHTVCYGRFPQPMLSRLCVLSLRKQNKIKIKTTTRHSCRPFSISEHSEHHRTKSRRITSVGEVTTNVMVSVIVTALESDLRHPEILHFVILDVA